MILREEIYELREGTHRITLLQSGTACGLAVEGKPIVVNWDDCQGSVGQEYFLVESLPPEASLQELRRLVAEGFSETQSLGEALLPLLRQFPSGNYTLSLAELDDWCLLEWDNPAHSRGYYPFARNLVPTQPDSAVSETRALEWAYAIEAGARPVALTTALAGSWCEFILDGHHKLWGYGLAGLQPRCLRIVGPPTGCSAASLAHFPVVCVY